MSGTEWFQTHREEFEAQRDASVALRATIEAEAATQRETRHIVQAEQQFIEGASRLDGIKQRLDSGQPEDTLPKRDLTFLHGFAEASQRRGRYGGSRRRRWPRAVESLPAPPPDASEHVVNMFVTRRAEVEQNMRATVMHCVMQEFRWYQELARQGLCKSILKHAKFCGMCGVEVWAFLLDLPPYIEPFDRTGNYKPHKPTEGDPEAEPPPAPTEEST